MNPKKRIRARSSAYRRARHAAARRRNAAAPGISRAFVVFAVLFLALGLRLTSGGRFEILKNGMSDVLNDGGNVKDAVAVLGQAIIGANKDSSRDQSAIVTFGKKLLGLEDDSGPANSPDGEEITDAVSADTNVFVEIAPETSASRSAAAPLSDRLVLPAVAESPAPETITAQNLRWDLPEEETEDTTPNVAFEIPNPDKVDDTKYELPFAYQHPLSSARITSGFGYRIHPIHGNTTFHYGVDLAAASGTPVYAFAGGTVEETGYNSVYGNYVLLSHPDGFASFYGHLSKVYVKNGADVSCGQKIAAVGSTGWSTGPHLHFEVRKNGKILNPLDYLSFE